MYIRDSDPAATGPAGAPAAAGHAPHRHRRVVDERVLRGTRTPLHGLDHRASGGGPRLATAVRRLLALAEGGAARAPARPEDRLLAQSAGGHGTGPGAADRSAAPGRADAARRRRARRVPAGTPRSVSYTHLTLPTSDLV